MKHTLLILLILSILFCSQNIAQTNTISYSIYNSKNGLPDNSVWQTVIDNKGFIWTISDWGICRFDGNTFKKYYCYVDEKTNSTDYTIKTIVTNKNDIVALSNYYFYVLDTLSDKFLQFELPNISSDLDFESIFFFENKILLAGNKAIWFDLLSRKFEAIPELNKINLNRLEPLSKNQILVLDKSSRFYTYNPTSKQILEFDKINSLFKGKNILSFQYLNNEKCLVNVLGETLYQLDLGKLEITHFGRKENLNTKVNFYNIYHTTDSIVYFHSSKNGFESFNTKNTFYETDKTLNELYNFTDIEIRHGFKDKANNLLWLSTNVGLFKVYENPYFINIYPITDKSFLSAALTFNVFHQNDSVLNLATFSGLFHYNSNQRTLKSIKIDSPNTTKLNQLFHVERDMDNMLWASGKNYCIGLDEKNNYKIIKELKFVNLTSQINVFKFGKGKSIFLGTSSDGVIKYDIESKKRKTIYNTNQSPIGDLLIYNDSLLFIATQTNGLVKLNLITNNTVFLSKVLKPKLLNETANYLLRVGNEIWFSTYENGIGIYNVDKNTLHYLGLNEGLPNVWIENICLQNNKFVYGVSNNRMFSIDVKTKKVKVYDSFNFENSLKFTNITCNDSNVWAITANSIINLKTINYYHLYGKPTLYKENFMALSTPKNFNKKIELNYNQNNIELHFGLLDFSANELPKYFYRIATIDTNWKYNLSGDKINLPNLNSGQYLVQVKAINALGDTSNSIDFSFTILNPFYKTWWFYALCICFITLTFYSIYKYRLSKFLELQKLRDSISKDLHDDVGSSLSTIQILSAFLKKNGSADAIKVKDISDKINSISQSTMENMSDIVWSINPSNDSFETIVVKIKYYLAEMCEPAGIYFNVIIEDAVLSKKLAINKRRDFYLLFKEVVNNAVKYSQCTTIDVKLSLNKNNLQLMIGDNGKGFDINSVKKGNGLNNIQSRSDKMDGILKIDSENNKGTLICLTLKLT